MNPNRVERDSVETLTDLPNVGIKIAEKLESIGVVKPNDLNGKSPYKMYEKLCSNAGIKIDPCLLDVLLSITHFINGDKPRPWWKYTEERKANLNK